MVKMTTVWRGGKSGTSESQWSGVDKGCFRCAQFSIESSTRRCTDKHQNSGIPSIQYFMIQCTPSGLEVLGSDIAILYRISILYIYQICEVMCWFVNELWIIGASFIINAYILVTQSHTLSAETGTASVLPWPVYFFGRDNHVIGGFICLFFKSQTAKTYPRPLSPLPGLFVLDKARCCCQRTGVARKQTQLHGYYEHCIEARGAACASGSLLSAISRSYIPMA